MCILFSNLNKLIISDLGLRLPSLWELHLAIGSRRTTTVISKSVQMRLMRSATLALPEEPLLTSSHRVSSNLSSLFCDKRGLVLTLIDIVVRHLPDWMPRPSSLKFARKWRWAIEKLYEVPFAAIQDQMVRARLFHVSRHHH
jgi:hypothetical protein